MSISPKGHASDRLEPQVGSGSAVVPKGHGAPSHPKQSPSGHPAGATGGSHRRQPQAAQDS